MVDVAIMLPSLATRRIALEVHISKSRVTVMLHLDCMQCEKCFGDSTLLGVVRRALK